ncbi:hypothetical protein [Candidatus Viridilinea mediisalina]|uniref:Uncharacterized protein n=1 Tax=Candidatus Viridilinea mediisalina TaxID=2024553 RepID=A0A2A6RM37_9CHLR|nr:hypothetical protein [Candidatus Viridilinea mediisalina]PDW04164.1 hypothetical protein CJ255_04865 [Candidatus Viridilinea mediisalina]
MTPARPNVQPHKTHLHAGCRSDGGGDSTGTTALRALLLLTEAVQPHDQVLNRISDQELALLRAALVRLHGGDPRKMA